MLTEAANIAAQLFVPTKNPKIVLGVLIENPGLNSIPRAKRHNLHLGLINLLTRRLDQLASHPSEPIADVGDRVPASTDRHHKIRFFGFQFQ